MMLTEQTMLMAGSGGRRAANHYAAGAAITLLVIIVALVFFGRAISLPTEPSLSATVDVVLGIGLLLVAVGIRYLGRHRPPHPRPEHGRRMPRLGDRPEAAFPFGIFSMATNFTTLALVMVAAKDISTAEVAAVERMVLVLVLVAICSVPAWAPLALTGLAPRTGDRALDALNRLIAEYGRSAIVVLLAGVGVVVISRGIVGVV